MPEDGIKNREIIVYVNPKGYADEKDLRYFKALCKSLAQQDVNITTYTLDKDVEKFMRNRDLWLSIHYAGAEILPATYVNGHIEKIERYPSEKEIKKWISDDKYKF